MKRLMLAAVTVVLFSTTLPGRAGPASSPITTAGYIAMADGVTLHYTLVRPSTTGRFPVLFIYDDYGAGEGSDDASVGGAFPLAVPPESLTPP